VQSEVLRDIAVVASTWKSELKSQRFLLKFYTCVGPCLIQYCIVLQHSGIKLSIPSKLTSELWMHWYQYCPPPMHSLHFTPSTPMWTIVVVSCTGLSALT